jgi:hypothetical protein
MAKAVSKISGKKTPSREDKPITADPLDIKPRLYRQLGRLLDDMESADRDDTMTFPQRINSLIAVGRVLVMFSGLRKAEMAFGGANPGSKVQRYAAAFAAPDGARQRAPGPGSAAEPDELDAGDGDLGVFDPEDPDAA